MTRVREQKFAEASRAPPAFDRSVRIGARMRDAQRTQFAVQNSPLRLRGEFFGTDRIEQMKIFFLQIKTRVETRRSWRDRSPYNQNSVPPRLGVPKKRVLPHSPPRMKLEIAFRSVSATRARGIVAGHAKRNRLKWHEDPREAGGGHALAKGGMKR